tara:strand:- start:342 stop:719 length:378 start_codon:yes stop_codon:yes gene_type:complete
MSIKILLLKSGEDLIADVQEMVSQDDNVIGYLLNKPCVVKLRSKTPDINPETEIVEERHETTIKMYPWMPLAKEQVIPLSTDWVVTMVTPQDKIEEMYTQDVLKNFKQDDQTDNPDESDKTGLTD